MPNIAKKLPIGMDEYLQGELVSDIKYEYVNGEVYAMTGARRAHNLLCMTLANLLYNHLRGTPCQVFGSDMKIGILTSTDSCFYYPDVHVSCEQNGHDLYNQEPTLIIEVLSSATERKDRAEKFRDYRKLPSLGEYVLVAQDGPRVEIYRKRTGWDLELWGASDQLYLESVDLHVTVATVYQDIVL